MADAMLDVIRAAAQVCEPGTESFRAFVARLAESQVVLLGEATHGTHEFYEWRAEITKTLIVDHGFNVIAVEADWPDAFRVHRWIRNDASSGDAQSALGDFTRFPRWMWRNHVIVSLASWLREYNAARPSTHRVGFYGLDLYSLHRSIEAVLAYLQQVDAAAAERARYRYGCFEDFGEDTQAYGYAATLGLSPSCEKDVIAQLVELRQRLVEYVGRDGRFPADEHFFAEQNARLVKNAEAYYRAMFGGRAESWNLRDRHMVDTLESILTFVSQQQGHARAVIWAHNSHLGDARATSMRRRGELNVGQLVRERFGDHAVLVGFTTHDGTVTAASDWDGPAERKRVRPSLPESYEHVFHATGIDRFLLWLDDAAVRDSLMTPRLERAIGVIYRPESERVSHYFQARLPDQFDAILHIDRTTALEPLDRWARHEPDAAETYPFGV
jgi:erythromycin esterase-like protein